MIEKADWKTLRESTEPIIGEALKREHITYERMLELISGTLISLGWTVEDFDNKIRNMVNAV